MPHRPAHPDGRYPQLTGSDELTADILVLVAGLAVLEMSLLAGSALAVGARRRYERSWPQPGLNPLAIPWLNVAISLLVIPAVAMLGAALFTRSRLPIERRE